MGEWSRKQVPREGAASVGGSRAAPRSPKLRRREGRFSRQIPNGYGVPGGRRDRVAEGLAPRTTTPLPPIPTTWAVRERCLPFLSFSGFPQGTPITCAALATCSISHTGVSRRRHAVCPGSWRMLCAGQALGGCAVGALLGELMPSSGVRGSEAAFLLSQAVGDPKQVGGFLVSFTHERARAEARVATG